MNEIMSFLDEYFSLIFLTVIVVGSCIGDLYFISRYRKRIEFLEKQMIESNFKSIESLSVEDIDLIRPILNDYMKSLDSEHGCGYSLTSDYWPLMLKLLTIRCSLKPSGDEDK